MEFRETSCGIPSAASNTGFTGVAIHLSMMYKIDPYPKFQDVSEIYTHKVPKFAHFGIFAQNFMKFAQNFTKSYGSVASNSVTLYLCVSVVEGEGRRAYTRNSNSYKLFN